MSQIPSDEFRTLLDHVKDGVYVLDTQRRIVHWNRGAEEISGYPAAEVVGHCCSDNVLVHIDSEGNCLCKSGCPVAATLADGKERQADVFLHHRDGYRVPIRVWVKPVRDAAGKIVSAVETFHENSELQGLRSSIEILKRWTQVDLESGTAGRRIVEVALQSRIEEMRRFGWSFGIFLAEIDFYNDMKRDLQPEMFSRVCRMVGKSIQNSVRGFDTVGRWDEDHFLVIIANVGVDELQAVCARSRILVEASFIHTPEGPYRATVSIGATTAEEGDSTESMLRRAELCLFESRSSGRNRVTVRKLPDPFL